MKDKKIIIISLLIFTLILIGIFIFFLSKNKYEKINTQSTKLNVEYSNQELTGAWKEYKAKITLNDSKVIIEGSGVINNNNAITINSSGTYYITGNLSDGNIVINANNNDDVQLVLDNTSINSSTTSPINCISCNSLIITLNNNSNNILTDSSSYSVFTDTEKTEPNGMIFSKSDLIINGDGKLTIQANYTDGIVSKDSLKIINCNIDITSVDDGIRGKDFVALNNANININANGDGIRSNNDTDLTLGYILIENSDVTINSKADGIQAETILNISKNSNINIITTGEITKSNNNQNFMNFRGGLKNQSINTNQDDSETSKALKAGNEITIEDCTLNITSTDDSIHSNGIIIINGGDINISSDDDGIHADTNIVINNGNINISKSYEGIESNYVEINNGKILVYSSDDGINISGGNDSSSMTDRIGTNNFSSVQDSDRKLIINGGNIVVNAEGDGLDSNGAIYINNGEVTVAGPNSTGNGALDYDSECVVSGGKLIIYGAIGMWQNPTNNSTQCVLTFQASGNKGDKIVLKDNENNEILSFETEKSYQCISLSNNNIEKGKNYTLYINGTNIASIEATSIINSNIPFQNNINGGMGQQMNKGGNKHINY